MKIPLIASASATFVDDGTGTGGTIATAYLSPQVYGVSWTIKRVVVYTTSSGVNGSSRFFLYRNNTSPSSILDSTYSGDSDTSETDLLLNTLDTLVAVWTGGDLGTVAQINVTGEQER